MADWDANSPRLTENLVGVLRRARAAAFRRDAPSLEDARVWHREMMAGLRVPRPSHVGRFRGEAGLDAYRVRVGVNKAVAPDDVGGALARFQQTLQSAVAALDERYPSGQVLDVDGLAAVIDLCGWLRAIHSSAASPSAVDQPGLVSRSTAAIARLGPSKAPRGEAR